MTRRAKIPETPRPRVVRPPEGREDWTIAVCTALLVVLGAIMVLDASYFFAEARFGDPYLFSRRQLLAGAIGVGALLAVSRVPTRILRRATYPLLVLVLLALAATLVPGVGLVRGGARRWLSFGPLLFQASEVAKLAVVLYLAHSLAKKGERIRILSTGFVPHLVVVGTVAALVVAEPDYGTTILLGGVLFAMLVANGARWSHLLVTGMVAVVAAGWGAAAADYRWQRIVTFLDPWQDAQASGFQLVQSLVAFGSGGIHGTGLGAGLQKLHYLPGAHTDFVFSVIGEELGLVGTLGVLLVFATLAGAGFRMAWRQTDPYTANLALGVTVLLVLQAAVNMAVATGLVPTKGIALPFLSYGGSALVVSMASVGVLLSVGREARA